MAILFTLRPIYGLWRWWLASWQWYNDDMALWAGDKLLGLGWLAFGAIMTFFYFFYWPITFPITIFLLLLLGLNFYLLSEILLFYVKVIAWIVRNGFYGYYRNLKCNVLKLDCDEMDLFI